MDTSGPSSNQSSALDKYDQKAKAYHSMMLCVIIIPAFITLAVFLGIYFGYKNKNKPGFLQSTDDSSKFSVKAMFLFIGGIFVATMIAMYLICSYNYK